MEQFLFSVFVLPMYSPYMISKVISEMLGREVRPQMVYLYTQKGYIEGSVIDGKIQVTQEEVIRWVTKYVTKNDPEFVKNLETV